MVCLLLECFLLVLGDVNMAVACRLIITLLMYLGYVLKRDLTQRALKQKRRRLHHLYVYVLFICCAASGIFHGLLLIYFVQGRLYSLCVVALSLPITLDEYCEIAWLKERHRHYKLQRKLANPATEEPEVAMRTSLYYAVFSEMQRARLWLLVDTTTEETSMV